MSFVYIWSAMEDKICAFLVAEPDFFFFFQISPSKLVQAQA